MQMHASRTLDLGSFQIALRDKPCRMFALYAKRGRVILKIAEHVYVWFIRTTGECRDIPCFLGLLGLSELCANCRTVPLRGALRFWWVLPCRPNLGSVRSPFGFRCPFVCVFCFLL